MDIRELQIGDWVLQEGERRTQVRGIVTGASYEYENGVYVEDRYDIYHPNLFEGLRITPEFLTDNGFVQKKDMLEFSYKWEHDIGDGFMDITIIKVWGYTKHYSDGRIEFDWKLDTPNVEGFKFQFVHELQHALKLSKIDIKFSISEYE